MANLISDLDSHFPARRRYANEQVAMLNKPDQATYTDGVMRWVSNNAIPFPEMLELAAHIGKPVDVAKSKAARDTETSEFLAAYRKLDPKMTREEIAEARANHPPGTKLVNVCTGRVTVL